MNRAAQITPWIISAVLAAGLAGGWFKLNDQLQQKDAELTALTEELSQARVESTRKLNEADQRYNALSAEVSSKLSEAEKRYSTLSTEANNKLTELAAAASEQIEQASLPEVQVRVTFRKAILNSGHVARIANLSSRSIAFTAQIERPASGKSKSYEMTLDPSQSKEIGSLEGWPFIAGDVLTISQAAHKSKTVVME